MRQCKPVIWCGVIGVPAQSCPESAEESIPQGISKFTYETEADIWILYIQVQFLLHIILSHYPPLFLSIIYYYVVGLKWIGRGEDNERG